MSQYTEPEWKEPLELRQFIRMKSGDKEYHKCDTDETKGFDFAGRFSRVYILTVI